MKLKEIAEKLECTLEGNGEVEITGANSLERAGPNELTFLANRRYTPLLKSTRAGAVLLAQDFVAKDFGPMSLPALRCADPYLAFAHALEFFYRPPRPSVGTHPTAVIAPTACIGPNASIGPFVVIEDDVQIGVNAVLHSHVVIYRGAKIGDDCYAHSHAVVREFCQIGDRVILQNGVVIGADGFGFAKQADGSHYKMVQSGVAVIEDDVEVQANSCVDRATVGETRVRRGAKLDNFVQVGHASDVGENAILCAQVGLAGSSHLGKNVLLAGQVGVAGHLSLGDNVIATAQSGIPNDVPSNTMVSGYPAMENKLWLKCCAVFGKLPELQKTVRELKKVLERGKRMEEDDG
ncbi:MAG: UDP-3-O-(3-hydroxymyristoyl)glucosamine N-acyltransferase [Acidobacteria bacterium RIFCSPLOWO2_02_FULL_61_28]|nr:MAG: UDP-3-O-(3-hydroxymyristoyl)glucosamine N-acyltransferase [Acidobacteria bacterium RIFCSPLOWO2_02_FULL_61_28]